MNELHGLGSTTEIDSRGRTRIHRRLVHKAELRNVFVERVDQVLPSRDGHERFLVTFVIEPDHPFFFEHPIDHAPGLMLVEGLRQACTAISHLFYGVPFGLAFILDSLDVKFARFAELSSPVCASITMTEKHYRRERLTALASCSEWLQDGQSIGSMDARWSFAQPAVLARLRRQTPKSGGMSLAT